MINLKKHCSLKLILTFLSILFLYNTTLYASFDLRVPVCEKKTLDRLKGIYYELQQKVIDAPLERLHHIYRELSIYMMQSF